jgi:hypothetical protein
VRVEATSIKNTTDQPDPPAQHYVDFIEYELEYARGELRVLTERKLHLTRAQAADRRMGRFAFELMVGQELLERVRFDFPLLGASQMGQDDPIEQGLTSHATIRVPWVERANRAQLLDRKTRKVVVVPWPPASMLGADTEAAVPVPHATPSPAASSAPAAPRCDETEGGRDCALE